MQVYKTQEQINADSKNFELMAAAGRVSKQDSQEIAKRHKQFKKRAKNLAGLKGANKSALEYERLIITERLEAINAVLKQDEQDRKELHEDWIDNDSY